MLSDSVADSYVASTRCSRGPSSGFGIYQGKNRYERLALQLVMQQCVNEHNARASARLPRACSWDGNRNRNSMQTDAHLQAADFNVFGVLGHFALAPLELLLRVGDADRPVSPLLLLLLLLLLPLLLLLLPWMTPPPLPPLCTCAKTQ